MSSASTRHRLSESELAEMLALVRESDSVELKLTIPQSDQRATVAALDLDPLAGADPPGLLPRHAAT